MSIPPCTLGSGASIKNYFTLVSATVSESVTCGGSGLSILMVYKIFNSSFLVGSTASNKISVVEVGAMRSVMISFADCFKKSTNFTSGKGYSWGIKVTVSQSHTWFVCGK